MVKGLTPQCKTQFDGAASKRRASLRGQPRRRSPRRGRVAVLYLMLAVLGPGLGAALGRGAPVLPASSAPAGSAAPPITYELDLRRPESHLVRVTMTIPDAAAGTELQYPAWYALYQIRDFIKDVQELGAECDGRPIGLVVVDLNTRRSPGSCARLEVHYAVYANAEPPFSSGLDSQHGFFNPAMLLFYLPGERQRQVRVKVVLPPGWKLSTLLDDGPAPGEYQAANYDMLADSPIEAGTFQEYSYVQSGATYRVIVDARPADYSSERLLKSLQKITATETSLMRDVPFSRYTFIFHFSAHGGGGMEHANGTAITESNERLRTHLDAVDSVVAHEFFHLWNVKRIRPQGLEPIDYVHGNDTGDLWFSEGVTSTYGELTLLRAGLVSRRDFYANLADAIHDLESRPARKFQSAEQSGREAWLERYSDYYRPERSISYYNKGELLGFLLDLGIRRSTHNRCGLDEVMRSLNENFARRRRLFTGQDLEQTIRGLAPEFIGLDAFFRDYVTGTRELDCDTYLGYAGLRRTTETAERPALGFLALRAFDGPVRVESVEPGSDAERAGLRRGDILVEMNGRVLRGLPSDELEGMKPGQRVRFRVRRGRQSVDLEFKLGSKSETVTRVTEMPSTTVEQLAVREGWLRGVTNP
jgi:predicted metalloprotease with PDZ domain